jgi:hypothetical protein
MTDDVIGPLEAETVARGEREEWVALARNLDEIVEDVEAQLGELRLEVEQVCEDVEALVGHASI